MYSPSKMPKWSFVLLLFLLPLLPYCSLASHGTDKQVKALFAFGDYVVDNGNNLYLKTTKWRANYLPYGLDLGGPSGRFTNARVIPDILGQLLGLPHFIPPFLAPNATGKAILNGVNYGSSPSGILNTTLSFMGLPLNTQINFFENATLPDLRSQMNESELSSYLSKSIYFFNSGAYDYGQLYFNGNASDIPMTVFTDYLIEIYRGELKRVYHLGARKFVLFGILVMGCIPVMKEWTGIVGCNEEYNYAARLFNARLQSSIDNITQAMPGSAVVFANPYGIIDDILKNPSAYGYKVADQACCETTVETDFDACGKGGSVCQNRSEYVYFDGVRLTDRAYESISLMAFFSNLATEVYPFNIEKLANLNLNSSAADLIQGSWSLKNYGKDIQ